MARRSRQGPSFLETLAGVFIAGVVLASLVLTLGLGVEVTDAFRLAIVGVGAMLSVSVLSLGATLARRAVSGGSSKTKLRNRVPIGLARRVDRRAGKKIRQHAHELSRQRGRCAAAGNYGVVDGAKWRREQDTFIDTVLLQGVKDKYKTALKRRARLINGWRRRIDAAANRCEHERASAGVGLDFRPGMDGFEYEAYCARVLTDAGWKVSNKGDTGDQGVDLIAQRKDMIVAIQCKRYRGSVGNSAVQEIFAGRLTVSPKAHAAVVTNAAFTRSAKELAQATGVYLLQHDDLPQLENLIQSKAPVLKVAA